ncbi:outer membrane beta-barrel protein [Sphingomonas sp. RB56-2]|uniref:Outer membrane beta-barrel protein n=1 Tax=Sphingomonas brevis TaxID=2908206 RepID=A0ABT0S7K8_9SPHN|nr:outer membrane beta-barrel protein [Sphingomonas brevis]MCL6740292.1 outer membrane beta-barrel protein [Sphingomonas brevis]
MSTALVPPASAQQGDAPVAAAPASKATRTTAYQAAFFAQYAPRTALDIARQVPGFALDLGDQDTRGFAGAAGNVVINGARPSSKAESLETTLARIPANRVVRVEVGPGDLYGSEYSTKSQVLNVILSAAGGIDGNITASARRLYTGKVVPDGSVSALIRKGSSSINLSAGFANALNHEEGTDTLRDADTGELLEFRRKHNSYHDFNPYVSGSWALEKSSNEAYRLNARWSPGQFDLKQRNHVTPTGSPERDDDLIQDFDNPVFELGGDVTQPLAGGAVKLVGLATRRKRDWLERYRLRTEGGEDVLGGSEQLQDAQRNETILRVNWTRSDLGGFSVETGIEGALNTLDHQVQLFRFGADGELDPVDLAVDQADVKEKRAEAFVRVGRQLSNSIRVDAGVNYEYSKISVRGDVDLDRDPLRFWKPSLTFDWKGGKGWHGQLSVRRTVAQLDFYDFISSAELSADRINGGNPNLVPQQTWEFRGTLEHPLLGEGLAKLDVGYDLVNDFQDRVLICDPLHPEDCFDAPGNLGTGKRYFARLTLDAPLAQIGLNGVRVKFDGTIQRTRVEDPISGEQRNWSDFFPDWQWNIDVRHDIGNFSYGFNIADRDRFTFFRTDEFDTNWNGGVYMTAFVEYRPRAGTTITLDLDNAIETPGLRERLIFDPHRGAADPFVIDEFRERNRHLNFGLTLRQSFGGGGSSSSGGGGAN